MNLYFAGPLFTQAERAWNLKLAALLAGAGHSVFLPQAELPASAELDADAIFRIDIDGIRSADAVVAILDGADLESGTSFECGFAFALGLPIVAVRTDFRAGGDSLPGQRLPTINLMISQASTVIISRTEPTAGLDDLASEILRNLDQLPRFQLPITRVPTENHGQIPNRGEICGLNIDDGPINP